jgi:hypothetical protein
LSDTSCCDWLEEHVFTRLSRHAFFETIQGQSWFHRELEPHVLDELPTWAAFNEFLSAHRLSQPRVRMSHEGKTATQLQIFDARRTRRDELIHEIRPEAVLRELRDGGTLVLDAVENAFPGIARITAAVGKHFRSRAQANAYITLGDVRGFGLHWDDHDVLVIHLCGRKQWDLYGFTRRHPMHKDFHEDLEVPTQKLASLELSPGSLLYLPRGYWHDVVGFGEPTVHVTVGVTVPTGIDLLGWVQDQAREFDFFRRDLPLLPDPDGAYIRKFRVDVAALLTDDVVRRFFRDERATAHQAPTFSLPYGAGKQVGDLARAVVRLACENPEVVWERDKAVLSVKGRKWTFASPLFPVLKALCAGELLSVGIAWERYRQSGGSAELEQWLQFIDARIGDGLLAVAAVVEAEGSLAPEPQTNIPS